MVPPAQAPASCMQRQSRLPPLVCPVCVGGQTALVLSTAISMCLPLPNSSLALPPLLTEELESRQVGWRANGQWSGVAGWVVGGCLSLGKWHRAGGHRAELNTDSRRGLPPDLVCDQNVYMLSHLGLV